MKITQVEPLFFGTESADDWLFVKVSTDEDLVGYGEASNAARIAVAAVEELGARLVGLDPNRIEQHWQFLYRTYHNVRGGPIATAAISGIEIALWDLKGKALGVPVYELLGGRCRDRLKAYANGWSRGADTPQAIADENVLRNPGARFWLPSDDEWYKAAYHQPAEAGGDPGS